ncbi:MAG TPA: glycosyltransferase [Bacteroidota bacterium]|nr:glycosyltransferase [Bacteroidota bacterium]
MRYSIVVPTYNEERYVARCLQSIRDQRYDRTQFEIIVADANSSDRTREVSVPLCDKFVSTEKRGIALGRNLGAANASGDYYVFVDADAILEQDFLSQLDLSFRDANVVAVTGLARPSDGKVFQRLVYRGTYVLVRLFAAVGIPLFPGICVAYRSVAFRRANGFREDFGIVEDLDLSRRVSATGKCVVNNGAIAHVSTRRLATNAFSTVLFHIYSDVKYLLTGRAAPTYPKHEELRSWSDLWRSQ